MPAAPSVPDVSDKAGREYVLTLSCRDVCGIVAAVSGFLAEEDGFIIESTQFGDPATEAFFLRMHFAAGDRTPDHAALSARFGERVGAPFAMSWKLHDLSVKPRMLVLVSKISHCLHDLLYRYDSGWLNVEIPAIVSNHETLRPLAESYGIPFHHLSMEQGKEAQESALLGIVDESRADLVVLARYMQILSPELSKALEGRAINIHHSFLPSFKGAKPYHQAHARGVKIIGATAHYVTDALDEGPIIEQGVERVDHTYSAEDLVAVGNDIERVVLARAVKYHAEHRVLLNGNKTVVFA